jgi:hypothetical protein
VGLNLSGSIKGKVQSSCKHDNEDLGLTGGEGGGGDVSKFLYKVLEMESASSS